MHTDKEIDNIASKLVIAICLILIFFGLGTTDIVSLSLGIIFLGYITMAHYLQKWRR